MVKPGEYSSNRQSKALAKNRHMDPKTQRMWLSEGVYAKSCGMRDQKDSRQTPITVLNYVGT